MRQNWFPNGIHLRSVGRKWDIRCTTTADCSLLSSLGSFVCTSCALVWVPPSIWCARLRTSRWRQLFAPFQACIALCVRFVQLFGGSRRACVYVCDCEFVRARREAILRCCQHYERQTTAFRCDRNTVSKLFPFFYFIQLWATPCRTAPNTNWTVTKSIYLFIGRALAPHSTTQKFSAETNHDSRNEFDAIKIKCALSPQIRLLLCTKIDGENCIFHC